MCIMYDFLEWFDIRILNLKVKSLFFFFLKAIKPSHILSLQVWPSAAFMALS